ncbi:hypothetical protein KW787_03050 [Candidatus Pacearchaeota archaeon]|nr:hypothetical protein [Candidatus Pacearchaeota archaeon]
MIIIKSELELKNWFLKNYKKLGYSKIIKKDSGYFPDFIMLKDNKEFRVELETISSNFILHKHDVTKVDEVVCIKKDMDLGVKIIEIPNLEYQSRLVRISATIGEETNKVLDNLLKDSNYRNKSHIIESAIKNLARYYDRK